MKKNILFSVMFLLFFCSSIHTSFAQIRIGVKGGYDLADREISVDNLSIKNRVGYQIGGVMEALIPNVGFGAEISVLYGRKEYKVEDLLTDASISSYDYISIPIKIKQRINFTRGFGLFLSGGIYGDVKIDGSNFKLSGVVSEYESKNFAFGLNAGAGVSLFNHLDIGVYFRGELTERYSADNISTETLKNKKFQTWSLGAAYFF